MPGPPRGQRAPRLSPDGQRAAVGIGNNVWVYDIPRDTLTRLTFEGENAATAAIWTPDGNRIIFPSARGEAPANLYWKPADGSGSEERLTTSRNTQNLGAMTPDGRTLVYAETDPKTQRDIWVVSMEGDRKPRVFLQTPFNAGTPRLSPDGRWLAYISDESGKYEVYVRPFPGPGGKWQISTEGGTELAWNPAGSELFYRSGATKGKMMAVDIRTQPTFSAGRPRLLFEGPYVPGTQGAMYAVSPDGQRFLMLQVGAQQQTSLTQINVVLNWFEELKQKVPVKQ
ncbi:MAG: PD40 domain-containing protein [Acidobacteria bacterium]|nr:PD40 domain-containing protein [Acidobacteriota bacterium]